MPRKPWTFRRRLIHLQQKLCRLLGLRRAADLLYVRLLEGFMSRKGARLLYDTARRLQGPGDIAEIGSWKGKSTVALGLGVERSAGPRIVHAIDHHRGSEEHVEVIEQEGSTWPAFQQTIREARLTDLVRPLKLSSSEAAGVLAAEGVRLRFLLVDGAHDEASVKRDLEAFLPLLLPEALVAFDDAPPDGPFPGVYRAYRDVLGSRCEELGFAGSILLVRLKDIAGEAARESGVSSVRRDAAAADSDGAVLPACGGARNRRRIAFFGPRKKRTLVCSFLVSALRRQGCEVLWFQAGVIRRRLGNRLADRYLRRQVSRFAPDAAMIFSGHISDATLDWLSGRFRTALILDDFFPVDALIDKIRKVDCFFLTNEGQLDDYRRGGARRVVYLHTGVDPFWHQKSTPLDRFQSDVAFIGQGIYPDRIELVKRLHADPEIDLRVYGKGWVEHGIVPGADEVLVPEFSRICASAKIVLGIDKTCDQELYFSNRTWFVLGCGGFLLTRYVPGLERIFGNREHLVWYRDLDEAVDLLRYYLKEEEERRAIACRGHELAHSVYPFDRSARNLLRALFYDQPPMPLGPLAGTAATAEAARGLASEPASDVSAADAGAEGSREDLRIG